MSTPTCRTYSAEEVRQLQAERDAEYQAMRAKLDAERAQHELKHNTNKRKQPTASSPEETKSTLAPDGQPVTKRARIDPPISPSPSSRACRESEPTADRKVGDDHDVSRTTIEGLEKPTCTKYKIIPRIESNLGQELMLIETELAARLLTTTMKDDFACEVLDGPVRPYFDYDGAYVTRAEQEAQVVADLERTFGPRATHLPHGQEDLRVPIVWLSQGQRRLHQQFSFCGRRRRPVPDGIARAVAARI